MRTASVALLISLFLCTGCTLFAQTQMIKGTIKDAQSGDPISYANVLAITADSTFGTVSDYDGSFELTDLKPDRYEIKISYVGYREETLTDVILYAHQPTTIQIELEETAFNLSEITIKPELDKKAVKNELVTVSGRLLSVEEANRYAGGFDDPARLASAFAGVSSNIQTNGISIRGNAPKYLQWKMEGIEIPNPNHFADLSVVGGGGLTALSSQVMDNADFLTGAMPAVYDNALSGVFDLSMRKGRSEEAEHHFQVGIIGIDVASEGPISREKKSSYLVNYRYSTLGLVQSLLPAEAGKINYQDLSFKLTFPSLKKGTIEWWGLGLRDFSGQSPVEDPALRKYREDFQEQEVHQYMGATGIKYLKYYDNRYQQVLRTQLAITANNADLMTREILENNQLKDKNSLLNGQWTGHFQLELNSKFGNKHQNFSGIRSQFLNYDLAFANRIETGSITKIVDQKGNSSVHSFYTNSIFNISAKMKMIAGFNARYFSLNKELLFEPRFSFAYTADEKIKLGAGYGLHSRLEPLSYYFTKNQTGDLINLKLRSSKAHHFVGSVQWSPAKNYFIKIEPYYQFLFDVPVTGDHLLSFINLENDWFLNDPLLNTGQGRNIGIDFTFERYIDHGFYGLFTVSLFDSKFRFAKQEEWLDSRFNSKIIGNLLLGKESVLGAKENKRLGINYRIAYQGGVPYTPVHESATFRSGEIVFDESQPFSRQFNASLVHHFTVNYIVSRAKILHQISLKVLNAGSYKEFESFRINLITQKIEEYREALVIPNLSYKISF